MGLKDIGIGWGRWLGLLEVSDAIKKESERRLLICDQCEFAQSSTFLEIVNNGFETVSGKFCTKCTCPCHQKSLTNDICPLGKWDIKNINN